MKHTLKAQATERLPDLIDAITDLIFILDQEFRILYANQAILTRLGYTLEEMREKSVFNFIYPTAHKQSVQLFSTALSESIREGVLPLAAKTGSIVGMQTRLAHARWRGHDAIAAISRELLPGETQDREAAQANLSDPQPSRIVFWTADANLTRLTHISEGFEDIAGISPQLVMDNPALVRPLFNPECLAKADALIANPGAGRLDFTCGITRPDGQRRHIRICALPVAGPDGKAERICGFIEDRTALLEMQSALRRTDNRLNSILDTINLGFTISTPNSFIDANIAVARILGYASKADFLKTHPNSVYFDVAQRRKIMARLENRENVMQEELRLLTRDGGIIWVSLSSFRQLGSGDWPDTCYYSFIEDITRRKEAEQALLQSERHMRSMLRGMSDAYVVIEVVRNARGEPADCRILEINPAFEKLVGIPAAQLVARTSREILGHPYALWRTYAKRVITEERFIAEVTLPFTGKFVRVSVFPAGDGTYAMFLNDLSIHHDEQKTLKKTRDSLRRLAAHLQTVREEERTRTASQIHEELSAAFTALHMELDALLEFGAENLSKKSAAEFTKKISELSNNASHYLKRTHELGTRLRPLVLDDLGIRDAIRWHLQELAARTGIKYTFESGLKNLPKKTSTALFRMFEDAANCAANCDHATEIKVTLNRCKQTVQLHMERDHTVHASKKLQRPHELAILSIKEQALALGGSAELTQTRTRVNLDIYLPVTPHKKTSLKSGKIQQRNAKQQGR